MDLEVPVATRSRPMVSAVTGTFGITTVGGQTMLSFSGSLKVFVAVEACDMRKGFNGLHALVAEPAAVAGDDSTTASKSRNAGFLPEGLARLTCTQRARVEYFSPVRRANLGSDSPLPANAASRSRRCALETRSRPLVSVITATFGITVAGGSVELLEPLVVIIALRTTITVRI